MTVTHDHSKSTAASDGSTADSPPLRKDAALNRQRIVEAAERLFAERGLDVSVETIAEAAGVGIGTVYRRFPNRELLIDAIFQRNLDQMVGLAQRAAANPDPWEGLVGFLLAALKMEVSDRGLGQLLADLVPDNEGANRCRQRIEPIVSDLLQRAQAAGQIREDISPTDLMLTKMAVAGVAYDTRDVDPEVWRRMATLAIDSLKPRQDAQSMPVPPLAPAQVEKVFSAMRDNRR